jgi:hypothetical protein
MKDEVELPISWTGSFLGHNNVNIKFAVEIGLSKGLVFLKDYNFVGVPIKGIPSNLPIIKNGIPILTREHNMYFHFVIEFACQLILNGITPCQIKECKILLSTIRQKPNFNCFQKQWFKVLYPNLTDENFIFLKKNDKVFCSYLYPVGPFMGPRYTVSVSQMKFSLIRDTIIQNLNLSNTIQDSMLLVKRTKSRTLENYNEVYDLCKKYCAEKNLKLVVFDDSQDLGDAVSQLKKFNSAKIVIGSHGAGFTNLLACKEGTKFIEFRLEDRYFCRGDTGRDPACFKFLTEPLKIEYYSIKAYKESGVAIKELNKILVDETTST